MNVLHPLIGGLAAAAAIAAAWPMRVGAPFTFGGSPARGVRAPSVSSPSEWKLREELRIGAGAGIDKLPPVSGVLADRTGNAWVLAENGEVLAFDRTGSLARRIPIITDELRAADVRSRALGRLLDEMRGPERVFSLPSLGPRELNPELPRSFGWHHDSLWVAIPGAEQLPVVERRGGGGRLAPYSADVEGGPANVPLALLADGSLLRTISTPEAEAPGSRSLPSPPGGYRMPVIPGPPVAIGEQPDRGFLVRASADGRVLQGLEIFTPRRYPVVIHNPYRETVAVSIPFQDHPLIAVTPDGSDVVFVERYVATRPGPASYSVARFDIASGRRTAHRYEYTPRTLDRTTIDSLLRTLVDSASTAHSERWVRGFPSVAAARRVVEAALELPAFHPPVVEVIAGADRAVWLRGKDDGRWTVLGRDGIAAGTVAMPRGVRLVHADATFAWGVIEPAPGRASSRMLVRYRIMRSDP